MCPRKWRYLRSKGYRLRGAGYGVREFIEFVGLIGERLKDKGERLKVKGLKAGRPECLKAKDRNDTACSMHFAVSLRPHSFSPSYLLSVPASQPPSFGSFRPCALFPLL